MHPAMQAAEVVAEVLAGLDDDAPPDAFYDDLCAAVCEVAEVERAVVFLYDRGLRRVRAAGAHRLDRAVFSEAYVTADTAIVARAALEHDEVVEADGDEQAGSVAEQFRPLVVGRRLACAPMVAAGKWIGVLLVDRPGSAPPLDDERRHLLWTLGKAAALAATARTATRTAERARQLEHRLDLAREVHDNVVQQLFGVSLALATTDGDLPAADRIRCAAAVRSALVELRSALHRPLERDSRPTTARFPDEVRRLAQAHPELRLDVRLDAEVPPELEPVAQSALTEAVRNARRHATPEVVVVRTRAADEAFVLEVENDGARPAGVRSAGMGLRLLAFEALRHGGFAEFGPRDGGRWFLRLVVPVGG